MSTSGAPSTNWHWTTRVWPFVPTAGEASCAFLSCHALHTTSPDECPRQFCSFPALFASLAKVTWNFPHFFSLHLGLSAGRVATRGQVFSFLLKIVSLPGKKSNKLTKFKHRVKTEWLFVLLDSLALGQGWRLGFLGLLHMDVFKQRLEQVVWTANLQPLISVHHLVPPYCLCGEC